MENGGSGDFFKGLIIGSLMGSIIALLYAPKSGKETREELHKNKAIAGAIPTPIVFGAIAAYTGSTDHIPEMNRALKGRRDLSHKRLNEIEGISATKPQAAFFIFPNVEENGSAWKNDYEFTRDLIAEACIDVNPGSNYGAEYSMGHFRIPYLPGENKLNMIYDKLESFMKKRMSCKKFKTN